MEKEKLKIKVQDVQTGQTLYECPLNESEKAYSFAAKMEAMGLDIRVIHPTLSDTLSTSLGLTQEQKNEYQESMEEEMEHHEGSCCFKDEENKDKLH